MKNVFMKIILFVSFLCVVAFNSNCLANEYDNNPSYQFLFAGGQGMNYLDLNSVIVDEYNPPIYQIRGEIVHVSGINGKVIRNKVIYRYNYERQKSYGWNRYTNKYEEVNRYPKNLAEKSDFIVANALFYRAYNIKFYK